MKQVSIYEELLKKVQDIVSPFLYPEALKQMQDDKEIILQRLQNEKGIKVPLVGNFDAGKSTLLNVLLGRGEILPTNITAETSIPYELYPMVENEHVELYRNGHLVSTVELSNIKQLSVAPGDVAHVFIDNALIRELATKGITLVDMPGLDSGIKEHNDAIINYINIGTAFALLADIETGGLTTTTIAFIKELLSYDLNVAIFLTKTDQKADAEKLSIIDFVKSQVKKEIGEDLFVGDVSAAEQRITDFINYVTGLNPDELIAKKYRSTITNFIKQQIFNLKNQLSFLSSDSDDQSFEEKIRELEEKKREIEDKLSGDIENADTPEQSTIDILDEVRRALSENAEAIATSIVKKEAPEDINGQILSIIRPVIISAFQKEGGEYAAALSSVVDDISKALQKALNIDEGLINSVVEEYKEDIQNFISIAAEALKNMNNPYVRILGYILDFFGDDIPDFIRWILGKKEEDRIAEATARINTTMYSTLQRKLYPVLLEQVKDQQNRIKTKVIEQVSKQIAQIEEAITAIINDRDQSHEELENKKNQLSEVITSLDNLAEEIQ